MQCVTIHITLHLLSVQYGLGDIWDELQHVTIKFIKVNIIIKDFLKKW